MYRIKTQGFFIKNTGVLGDLSSGSGQTVKGFRVQRVPKCKFREMFQGHSVYVHHLTSSYQQTPVATGQNNASPPPVLHISQASVKHMRRPYPL